MARAVVLQVIISGLSLDQRTVAKEAGKEDLNVVRFAISHPAEGIEEVATAKMIKAGDKMPGSWKDHELAMVFKTRLRGKAVLRVTALAIDKDSPLERGFGKFLGKAFSLALGVWTGGLGNAYVGAAVKAAGNTVLERGNGDGDEGDVDVIGEAKLELDSEVLEVAARSVRLELVVEKPVAKKVVQRRGPRRRGRRTKRVDEVVIPAGPNGHVEVVVSRLG